MSFNKKLIQAYFNLAYNPVYDFTTASFASYHNLQLKSIAKLQLRDNDRVLCVGIGTGNEITHILRTNINVNIVGIDCSNTALRKARKKAILLGKEIEVFNMDARTLEFGTGSFDKVLCLHVTDFLEETIEVTREILRVLKDGGEFVITYPSDMEGPGLGFNLLKDDISYNIRSKNWVKAFLGFPAKIAIGAIYLPLMLRSKKRAYSRQELEAMLHEVTARDFQIEEYPVYRDFIVYGTK